MNNFKSAGDKNCSRMFCVNDFVAHELFCFSVFSFVYLPRNACVRRMKTKQVNKKKSAAVRSGGDGGPKFNSRNVDTMKKIIIQKCLVAVDDVVQFKKIFDAARQIRPLDKSLPALKMPIKL